MYTALNYSLARRSIALQQTSHNNSEPALRVEKRGYFNKLTPGMQDDNRCLISVINTLPTDLKMLQ